MRNKLISKEDVIRERPKTSKLRRLWWKFKWKLEETHFIPYSWKHKYWDWVAYDYRPKELWYRITCKLFKKYSTVKSKYLDDRWVDRDHLMSETMFQILSDFVEQECVESIVDWYYDDLEYKYVVVDGVKVRPIDEILTLYNWYHLKYKKAYPEIEEQLWDKVHDCGGKFRWEPTDHNTCTLEQDFPDEEKQNKHDFLMSLHFQMEILVEEELNRMLVRLLNVRKYMWT